MGSGDTAGDGGTFDFIVVGAGSAGCALASRLSEDGRHTVLLLEAGGRDQSPLIRFPLATGKLVRSAKYAWNFATEPMPGAKNRVSFWIRGKVMGGCSSLNGMVYMRGHPGDYDHWAQLGNRGWAYRDVLPYFLRSERHESRSGLFHGSNGPLWVERSKSDNPLYDAFVKAGEQAGWPIRDDFNGTEQEGFGRWDFTIRKGRRFSSADAYINSEPRRSNLKVTRHAHARRLLIEDGRAAGVEYSRESKVLHARARREVILSSGVIGSPHLLMLSGIGDPNHLADHGIQVRSTLPGVGKNLQDHAQVQLRQACTQPVTLHSEVRLDRLTLNLARAVLFGSGPASRFPVEAGAFTRTRPELELPDVQWNFHIGLGFATKVWFPIPFISPEPLGREGFWLAMYLLRPESKGEILLRSADFADRPVIHANYLAAEADLETMRNWLHQARKVVAQPAFEFYRGEELSPGPHVRTDDEIDDWIRSSIDTGHHQVGTCKMGFDPMGVVDDELRVRGVNGLRVADASIMPTLIGGNTNAPSIMIGEKAADMVLGRPSLQSPDDL